MPPRVLVVRKILPFVRLVIPSIKAGTLHCQIKLDCCRVKPRQIRVPMIEIHQRPQRITLYILNGHLRAKHKATGECATPKILNCLLNSGFAVFQNILDSFVIGGQELLDTNNWSAYLRSPLRF